MNESAGLGYWVIRDEVISQYLELLVDIPDAAVKAIVINQLALPDVISLRQALFAFFTKAVDKAAEMLRQPSSSATNT